MRQNGTIVPQKLWDAREAWYDRRASESQLEEATQLIPEFLKALRPGELPEGEVMQWQMAVSGMAHDLAKIKAAARLRREGIE